MHKEDRYRQRGCPSQENGGTVGTYVLPHFSNPSDRLTLVYADKVYGNAKNWEFRTRSWFRACPAQGHGDRQARWLSRAERQGSESSGRIRVWLGSHRIRAGYSQFFSGTAVVQNAVVMQALASESQKCLPLVLMDGEIVVASVTTEASAIATRRTSASGKHPVSASHKSLTQVRQFAVRNASKSGICVGCAVGVCPYTGPEPGGLGATAGQHGPDRHRAGRTMAGRLDGRKDTRSARPRIARRDIDAGGLEDYTSASMSASRSTSTSVVAEPRLSMKRAW